MRWLLASLSAVLLSICAVACGSSDQASDHARGTTGSSALASDNQTKDSEDFDNDASGDDDIPVIDFGRAASPAEAHTITSIVKRYYAAAADEDGASACALLATPLAETVPEEFDRAGEARLHGSTCAAVLSKLFERQHAHISAEHTSLEVTRVRVEASKGLAVLRFSTTREPRKIALRREGGVWKVKELSDSAMP